ncbi:ABC transporter ATP-binding protein [Wohlfahrtiimonas chitiniclastica]|uniref:ABC transporter ATP-binding protein n=1 Tax=Wohlfahrtiimonas chitiniclastica TaxID=400946 RepID=UPI0007B3FFCA|nr:ABC transporter ATP-binding protein [Wohlfahrtiimonas chitiniclastica]KZS23009.1 ABC transporter ATP-binding protein [Wohlfahrtiimonas chitiniclastica]MBS7817393.1 ABC transporter ATP-binding protein [Wohlfahrtiimonas chitiniclastica]MBS7819588.1 ABC transporter ATP-binding protein [Wohlfahrtiimonas chitiniclastica]MBS7823539.1 ABC transporter ATP-binding protein [Wohlfahrtiimonas chitiniclastica]MBS7831353.1 ABC transporter ATP-binding protein [Wohlfahrtiimonas chitiniclastica]
MTPIILDVVDVSKTVQATEPLTILQDITFRVQQGESLAIVGSSGSGKSTLLGLLAGLDTVSTGSITLAGFELQTLNEDERAALRAQHVGFVFQSFQLLDSLTALENVMLPLELKGQKDARTRAAALLERVGLKARLNHYPKQLSGGEQQRVAIARAFAAEPAILFADEPTGNLDTKTGASIIELLFELNDSLGTTLILVTHEARLAERCEHRIQIEAGRLVHEEFDHA